MTHHYALLSLIYMMSFVIVFDKTRWQKRIRLFVSANLLGHQELSQLQAIWSACQES